MEKRYSALRIIGTIYKVLGVIAGVITIIMVLAICGASVMGGAALDTLGQQFGGGMGSAGMFGGIFGGLIGAFFVIIYGGGLAVTLYAFGEGIDLLLALEENTRATAMLLRQQQSPPPA